MSREAREPHTPEGLVRPIFLRLSPVSLSVFSLIPDLLFDCSRVLFFFYIYLICLSRVLEYAKIRAVSQSNRVRF